MKKSFFTMTELGITLSVTAIFAALVIPAMSNADTQSKTAACLDNQRICQVAAAAYANDHNGIMLLKSRDNQTYTLLWGMVRGTDIENTSVKTGKSYIKNFVPTICPELNVIPPSPTSPGANGIQNHYAVIYRGMKLKGGRIPARIDSMFCDIRNRDAFYMIPKRVSSAVLDTNLLKDPSVASVFGEAWSIPRKKGWYTYSFSDKSSVIDLRHDGKTNMVFADGHAASMAQSDFETLKKNKFILIGYTGRLHNSKTGETVEY